MLLSAARSAQTTDPVGVRALGMGGAFTAVADDATATWWNPAGLAGGAYFSADHRSTPAAIDRPGERRCERQSRVGFPALGISYYRLPTSGEIRHNTSTDRRPAEAEKMRAASVCSAPRVGQSIGKSSGRSVSTVKAPERAGETEGRAGYGRDGGVRPDAGRADGPQCHGT